MKGSELKMKKPRQKGFVLILVITAMAIIGLEMHVLAGGSNTMLFQSDTAYLKACERNLVTSGLAWAKQNIRNKSRENFEKTVELDVSKMNPVRSPKGEGSNGMSIRGSTLIVTISIPTGEEPQAQIKARVSRGRRTLRSDGKYKIRL